MTIQDVGSGETEMPDPLASIQPLKIPHKVVQPFSMKQIADLLLPYDDDTFGKLETKL